jgi:hypothetical protein
MRGVASGDKEQSLGFLAHIGARILLGDMLELGRFLVVQDQLATRHFAC